MRSQIPAFYRVWFTTIDPPCALLGAIGSVLAPSSVLLSYTANAVLPPTPETTVLLYSLAGAFAAIAILQATVLRARPHDVALWKMLQFGVLVMDVGILAGLVAVLRAEGRTEWALWRKEEWVNLGFTAWVAVVRLLFVLGFGVGGAEVEGTGKGKAM